MIKLSENQVANVVRIYLNSNTPMYLFRRLREDAVVQNLSREFATSELKQIIELGVQQLTCVENLVEVYAAFIALTLKPISETAVLFASLDLSALPWGAFLRDAAITIGVSNKRSELELPFVLQNNEMAPSPASTKRVEITFSNK